MNDTSKRIIDGVSGHCTAGAIEIRLLNADASGIPLFRGWRRAGYPGRRIGRLRPLKEMVCRVCCGSSRKITMDAAGGLRLIVHTSSVPHKSDRSGTLLAHHWFFEPRGGERLLAEMAALFPAYPFRR